MCVFNCQFCAQGDSSIAIQEMKPEVLPIKADAASEDLNYTTKRENEQLELPFTLGQEMGERHEQFGESEKKKE